MIIIRPTTDRTRYPLGSVRGEAPCSPGGATVPVRQGAVQTRTGALRAHVNGAGEEDW